MPSELYKGYIEVRGKKSLEKYKGLSKFKTYEQVKSLPEFAGVLAENTIFVDLDDGNQAEILMNIVEDLQLDCRVIDTTRGKHFIFRNTQLKSCPTHAQLAVGLTADIKVGFKGTYEVLKRDGVERFVEWDAEEGHDYQEIPKWLFPVKTKADFLTMDAGDGRNQALFNYILTLQSSGFTVEECRECITLLNRYVLKEPLSDSELEVILRDDAFKKPIFFDGNTLLHEKFAEYLKNAKHIVRINGQLHIYKDGIYVPGYRAIESEMIQLIPHLRDAQRKEVLKYLELLDIDDHFIDTNFIAFKNGLYDVSAGTLVPYSPSIITTNMIPWNFNLAAYSELMDSTLNKLACQDKDIRALLEELGGSCLYSGSPLLAGGKAFILTGDKANGKSTYIAALQNMLNGLNYSSLDLNSLGSRFDTASLAGKLANLGDDIAGMYIEDTSIFKKVVTGDTIKAEEKGQKPFQFNPYCTLVFSANDIPRTKDRTGAVLRRLVIIPFNATFSKDDPDFNPHIREDLKSQECIEYFIRLSIESLKRVIANKAFTYSSAVQKQKAEYEKENNPVLAFIDDVGEDAIINKPCNDVHHRYQLFCTENGYRSISAIAFSKSINAALGTHSPQRYKNGKRFRIFEK
jgi:putative DNA primase/helicase